MADRKRSADEAFTDDVMSSFFAEIEEVAKDGSVEEIGDSEAAPGTEGPGPSAADTSASAQPSSTVAAPVAALTSTTAAPKPVSEAPLHLRGPSTPVPLSGPPPPNRATGPPPPVRSIGPPPPFRGIGPPPPPQFGTFGRASSGPQISAAPVKPSKKAKKSKRCGGVHSTSWCLTSHLSRCPDPVYK
eukprot:Rmarinus@m.17009